MQSSIKDLRKFIEWYKGTCPCADCGGFFDPVCMDFDHVPERGQKIASVTEFYKGKLRSDEQALWNEIAKCDVVCSNCHRLRTKTRGLNKPAREKISRRRLGKKTVHSPETLAKISAASKARTLSPESRMKISMSLRGRARERQVA